MRTLKFIVDGRVIIPDPSCDFRGLFPAPNQEIAAEFTFSSNWDSIPKVAAFYSMLDDEYKPQIIDDKNRCMIPPEALSTPAFKMQIIGGSRDNLTTTRKITIYQRGGMT